jgi:hypothetical protein
MAISQDKFKKINQFFHVTGASTTLATSAVSATAAHQVTQARLNKKVEKIATYLRKRFQQY